MGSFIIHLSMIYSDGFRHIHVHKSSYSTFENSRIALLYYFKPYNIYAIDGRVLYFNCDHKFGPNVKANLPQAKFRVLHQLCPVWKYGTRRRHHLRPHRP